jgi:hypothetical protein
MDDVSDRTADMLGQSSQVDLTKVEMALIIDALLQAEITLPLLDRRHMGLKPIESLRLQQLSLANRLEDVMARANGRQDGNLLHPAWDLQWRREQP